MQWITDNFQVVALVLIAFAGWIKSRADARNAEQEPPEEPYDEREVFGPDEPWEQTAPDPGVPPPLIRTSPPELSPAAVFEANRESEAVLKHQQNLAERLRQIRETKATTTGGAAATRARVAASKLPKSVTVAAPLSLRARLHDKGELRRAFVLKEILAAPLSQR